MWEYRLLGWNMWKLKTKLQLIGSTEILFIVGWHLELKDGLLLLRGCVKGLLVLWWRALLLPGILKEVISATYSEWMLNFVALFWTCYIVYVLLPVIPSADGKRSMMKLAQRMVNNFCSSISTSNGHRWTTLSGLNEVGVRVTVHKSTDPGQPNGVVLSAATTIWLPISPQNVFNFFKDERTRPQVCV